MPGAERVVLEPGDGGMFHTKLIYRGARADTAHLARSFGMRGAT